MPRVAMPTARPMMLASASGELKTRVPPNARCSPCVTLKTPPLPWTDSSAASRLAVGDVLAEHDDARVARHLVLHRAVDGRDHRVGLAFGRGRRREGVRGRIDVGRVDVQRRGVGRRLLGLDGGVGGGVDLRARRSLRSPRARRRSQVPRDFRNSAMRTIGSRFASAARSSVVL